MDLSHYEAEREQLVDKEAEDMFNECLTDISKFEALESGYEFLSRNAGNLQRALRNLDSAIKGEEVGSDAIFTALTYIQANLKAQCLMEAEREIPDAYDIYEDTMAEALDARMDAAKDARLGL